MYTHKRGRVVGTTLLTLTLDGAHCSSPDPCRWTKISNAMCSNVVKHKTYWGDRGLTYWTLEKAKAACFKLGSQCHGVHDLDCVGNGKTGDGFYLCTSSNFPTRYNYGCVYKAPEDKRKCGGLFGRESIWCRLVGCVFSQFVGQSVHLTYLKHLVS